MTKYRFKTEKEFKQDDLWDNHDNAPDGWSLDMNKYMGQDVPEEYVDRIENGRDFDMDGWYFSEEDVIEKDTHKPTTSASTTQNAAAYVLIRRK